MKELKGIYFARILLIAIIIAGLGAIIDRDPVPQFSLRLVMEYISGITYFAGILFIAFSLVFIVCIGIGNGLRWIINYFRHLA